jgi:hypothetical protein
MTKSNTTQKSRLLKLLANGKEITTREAASRCAIANPSAVIAALREDGHVIWTNRRKDAKTGRAVYRYRYDATRRASTSQRA